MFMTQRTSFQDRDNLKNSVPQLETVQKVFSKYRQTIEHNRDVLDERPLLSSKVTQRIMNYRSNSTDSAPKMSPRKPEIAHLMKDKKNYEPNLIRNMLIEQDNIRRMAKIIMNLNEKSEYLKDVEHLKGTNNLEVLLSAVESNLDHSFKNSKKVVKSMKDFKINLNSETNYAKSHKTNEKEFLMAKKIMNLIESSTEKAKSKPRNIKEQNQEILNSIKEELKNVQMLENMDTFRIFKEFMFPIDIESLKSFLKENKNVLHTKNIKNLMVFEKLFTDYDQVEFEKLSREKGLKDKGKYVIEENSQSNHYDIVKILEDKELRKHIQGKFTTHFSMSERKQTQVMKSWLEFMSEEYVTKENNSMLNKLRNAQIIM